MSQRIKVVSAGGEFVNINEKIAPSLIKELKVVDYAKNKWLIRILYPKKNEETGLSVHESIHEEEFTGTMDEASKFGDELLLAHSHVEVEYYEIKFIPNYKKGKFALKLKSEEIVEDADFIEEDIDISADEDFVAISDSEEFQEVESESEEKIEKKVKSKKKTEKEKKPKKEKKDKPAKEDKKEKTVKEVKKESKVKVLDKKNKVLPKKTKVQPKLKKKKEK